MVPYLQTNKLPVLELEPEKFLFSSNAAARYLLSLSLTETNESAVDQWLEWESACLFVSFSGVFFFLFFFIPHWWQRDIVFVLSVHLFVCLPISLFVCVICFFVSARLNVMKLFTCILYDSLPNNHCFTCMVLMPSQGKTGLYIKFPFLQKALHTFQSQSLLYVCIKKAFFSKEFHSNEITCFHQNNPSSHNAD